MSGRRARLVIAVRLLHQRSTNNRAAITAAGRCACFCCGSRYPASAVSEWIDRGRTALCPCGCDAVLPDGDDAPVSDGMLQAMIDYWFQILGAKATPRSEVIS